MKKTVFIQITTATDRRKTAEELSALLLNRKIAACVQVIGPMDSRYWWKGKIEKSREWLLVIKTTEAHYGRVESAIRSVHPYETPEIIATPVVRGLDSYLAWIEESVE